MKNVFQITLLLFVVACASKSKKQNHNAVYDEAVLKNFVLTTANTHKATALHVMDSLLANAAKDSAVFLQTVAYLEKPFGNPNSSYRNEECYAEVLAAKMKSEWIDSATKSMTRERLYLLMQNRPGSLANDFNYLTAAGFKKKMYEVKANYLLLYFYNPECEACKEMKAALIASPVITNKIATGELKILAVYTDKDEKLWLDHLKDMPESWIHGRDENEYLYTNSVYNLKAIPTVYLLDKEKKVLLKDCMEVGEIEEALRSK